jgi:hypothetical protein
LTAWPSVRRFRGCCTRSLHSPPFSSFPEKVLQSVAFCAPPEAMPVSPKSRLSCRTRAASIPRNQRFSFRIGHYSGKPRARFNVESEVYRR